MSIKKAQLAADLASRLKCCTTEEFRVWLAYAPSSYAANSSMWRTFCHDCEPTFRAAMQEQGRCIALEHWPLDLPEDDEVAE